MSAERKSVFRSTMFPPDKIMLKDSGINDLADEICQILHISDNGQNK
jgi:hypothetical protein